MLKQKILLRKYRNIFSVLVRFFLLYFLKMITDKYNSIIMTAPATVEEISLEYIMTVDQGTLVPSWRIIVDESTAQIPYKCCVRFDALTGKELTW